MSIFDSLFLFDKINLYHPFKEKNMNKESKDNVLKNIDSIRDNLNGGNTSLKKIVKDEIKNTKNINEFIGVLNKDNNELLANIGSYSFKEVVQKLNNYFKFIEQEILSGDIKWEPSIQTFSNKMKGTIAQELINYASTQSNIKPIELNNFKDAVITVVTDYSFDFVSDHKMDTVKPIIQGPSNKIKPN